MGVCHSLAPLECARGEVVATNVGKRVGRRIHTEQHEANHGDLLDEIVDKNARIERTETMRAVAEARGFTTSAGNYVGENRLARPSLKRAHEFCRAVVPRRVYAIDPDTGENLFDVVTREPVAQLRRRGDTGDIELYGICPSSCTFKAAHSSHAALSDFGVGLALYFKNLALLSALCIFLFLVHLPVFYCNYAYKRHRIFNSNASSLVTPDLDTPFPPEFCGFDKMPSSLLIANNTTVSDTKSFVNGSTSVSSLSKADVAAPWLAILDRYGGFDYGGIDQPTVTSLQYITAIFCCATLLVTIVFSSRIEKHEIEQADTRIYSARDFTVMITGSKLPQDPKVYKKFYESRFEGSRVVRVAIIYNPSPLLRAISRHLRAEMSVSQSYNDNELHKQDADHAGRRVSRAQSILRKLKSSPPPSSCSFLGVFQSMGCRRDHAYKLRELQAAEKAVDEENRRVYQNDLSPSRVFVTFDDELDQHRCIRNMASDWCDRLWIRRDLDTVDNRASIQDILESCAHEDAPEPSDILWENLDYGWASRMIRIVWSTVLSFVVIFVLGLALLYLTLSSESAKNGDGAYDVVKVESPLRANNGGIIGASYLDQIQSAGLAAFIVLINFLLPMTIKLTSRSEIHFRESAVQVSILAKLVLARFLNSAVLTFLVTRKSDMLTSKFARKIQFLMIIDLFSSPLVRLFDVYNLFMRYVIAPRCSKTQAQMNKHFNGTFWNLAERYTDMMKKVFFAFYYAWLAPSGFLITGVALFVDYFVDKYLLLRRWRTPPRLHSHLSVAARAYFYGSTIVSAFMFIWAFRHWPFDCKYLQFTSSTIAKESECVSQLSSMVIYSTVEMPWSESVASSGVAAFGMPILLALLISGLLVSLRRTLVHCCWVGLQMCCCTKSSVISDRKRRRRRSVRQKKIERLKNRHLRRRNADSWKKFSSKSIGSTQAGRGGVKYSQLENPDWYIPRLGSIMEVDDADEMSEFMYRTQSKMQHIFRRDWSWAGQTTTFPDEFSSSKIFHSVKWIHRERAPGSRWLRARSPSKAVAGFDLVIHHTPAEYLLASGRQNFVPGGNGLMNLDELVVENAVARSNYVGKKKAVSLAEGHQISAKIGSIDQTINPTSAGGAKSPAMPNKIADSSESVTEGTIIRPWWWYGVSPSKMSSLERDALHYHVNRPGRMATRVRHLINQSPSVHGGILERIPTPPDIESLLRNSNSVTDDATTKSNAHEGTTPKTASSSCEYGSIEALLANSPSRQQAVVE